MKQATGLMAAPSSVIADGRTKSIAFSVSPSSEVAPFGRVERSERGTEGHLWC